MAAGQTLNNIFSSLLCVHKLLHFGHDVNRFVPVQGIGYSRNIVERKGVVLFRGFVGTDGNVYPTVAKKRVDALGEVRPDFVGVNMKNKGIHALYVFQR